MVAHRTAIDHGLTKAADAAVDRDGRAGAQALVRSPDDDLRPDGVGFGGQQGMDAVEPDGEIDQGVRVKAVVPGDPGVVRLGIGIGILPGNQLKGHDLLICEGVLHGDSVARAGSMIEAYHRSAGIDRLRRVGVEGPRVDIGAVGQRFRVGIDPALDQAIDSGVGGKSRAFTGQRDQHIAVYAASQGLLRTFESQVGTAPEAKCRRESVIVLVGRLDATGLEERSCAENAVGPGERQAPMEIARGLERNSDE